MDSQEIVARLLDLERRVGKLDGKYAFPPKGPYHFGQTSTLHIQGVHPDLLACAHYALRICPYDFGIPRTGGVRTQAMQQALLDSGASKTLNSRHLTGHALDVFAWVSGQTSWAHSHVLAIHDAFVQAGQALAVPLRWGGDWNRNGVSERGENDYVHHELPYDIYGKRKESLSPTAALFLKQEVQA